MVGQHDVVISAAGMDRKLAFVICIQLADRMNIDVDLVGLYRWELTSVVGKWCFFWFSGWRSLPSLGKVSFLGFDWRNEVFCSVCKSETWPRREVSSVDDSDPRRADSKTITSMQIAY